jgi:glycosyltransferase involved in cell wall biosynthesis
MPPVEAMAAGKPVVGTNEGYTKHQVIEGKTGTLFEPSTEELITAVRRHRNMSWDSNEIQTNARLYDTRSVRLTWIQALRDLINEENDKNCIQ